MAKLRQVIEDYCTDMLSEFDGNKTATARYLGITRVTLNKHLRSYAERRKRERRAEQRRARQRDRDADDAQQLRDRLQENGENRER